MEAGAVDFLRKPFTEEALLNAIQAALKQRHSEPSIE
jgi:FixJ family two-component response regulator